jgi:hypothetical protein
MKTHGLVVLLLAVSMTGVASAQEKTGPSKAEIPQVTIEQAIQAAVAKVPGRVHELEVSTSTASSSGRSR